MGGTRPARKAVSAAAADAFRDAVSASIADMEEPLRDAQHLIHILGAIAQYRGEDNEAVSTVAVEANRKLEKVEQCMRLLFRALRRADSLDPSPAAARTMRRGR